MRIPDSQPGGEACEQPVVVLRLEVSSSLEAALKCATPFSEQVRLQISKQVSALLKTLGIPGQCSLQICSLEADTTATGRFMRVRVNGHFCHYSDGLLKRLFCYVNDTHPSPSLTRAQIFEWLKKASNGPDKITDLKRAIEFLSLAVLEIVKRRPAALIGPDQLIAYRASLASPEGSASGDWPPEPRWLLSCLAQVINRKISISEKGKIAGLLQAGVAAGRHPADIAEDLITALASGVVEIHLPSDYLDGIVKCSAVSASKHSAALRRFLYEEFGLRYPAFRFVAVPDVKPNTFALKINDVILFPRIGLTLNQLLVAANVATLRAYEISGLPIVDPLYGAECAIVERESESAARARDLPIWDPLAYLFLCLNADLQADAPCFVHRNAIEEEVDRLKGLYPDLVTASEGKVSICQLTRCLRALVSESISVRNLRFILERLLDYDYVRLDPKRYWVFDDRLTAGEPEDAQLDDPCNLTSFIRAGMKDFFVYKYRQMESNVTYHLLDASIEQILSKRGVFGTSVHNAPPVSERQRERIVQEVSNQLGNLSSAARPIILTSTYVRPLASEILVSEFDQLTVLATGDLPHNILISVLAKIAISDNAKGKAFENNGNWSEAIKAYESTFALDETNLEYLWNVIQAYKRSGRVLSRELRDRAINACQQATKEGPRMAGGQPVDAHHYHLGLIYYSLGEYELAIREYDQAFSFAQRGAAGGENLADYQNSLGLAYMGLDRWEMAVDCFQKALRFKKEPLYYHNLGLAYHLHGLYDEAREALLKAGAEDVTAQVALARGYLLSSQPDINKAKEMCRLLMQKVANQPEVYEVKWLSGDVALKEEKFSEAAAAYEDVYIQIPPSRTQLLHSLRTAYEKAVESEPGNAEHYFNLGRTFARERNLEQSQLNFEKAASLGKGSALEIKAEQALGQLEYGRNRFDSARHHWERALMIGEGQFPDIALLYNDLGRAYDSVGDYSKACEYYQQATDLKRENIVARYNLASALLRLASSHPAESADRCELLQRALREFQEVRRMNPKFGRALYELGNCYYQLSRYDLAAKWWEEVIEIDPGSASAYYNLGVLSYKQGDRESAERYWLQAVSILASDADANFNLGVLRFQSNDRGAAVRYWSQALKIQPACGDAQQVLEIAQRNGCPEMAIRDIQMLT